MHQKYPHMFSPIRIGNVVFKNRIWSAPAGVHLLFGQGEYPNDDVIAYYANKAKGGTANITVSAQNMDIHAPEDTFTGNENIFKRQNHAHWRKLTDTIHFFGAKASIELLAFFYHGYDYDGRLVRHTVNGEPDLGGNPTVMLTRSAMEQIADRYADAAEAAIACGFDMLLIHGGHGLVLSQFLSPLFNTRTDEFGGSLENRMRFPMMVLDAIRERVGRNILIEYRISGSELAGDEGFTVEDCIEVLKVMQEKIDIAHISVGSLFGTGHITHPTNFLPAGCNAYLAKAVKACPDIHIPILTLGAFQDPQLIEDTIAGGGADLVAMARGTIADAHLVRKAHEDKADEIIPCTRCLHCLDYGRAGAFACSVNPTVGREARLPGLVSPVQEKKNIVVVGGGPAGMEAAITAASRGHAVTLMEQADRLGGKLVFSLQAEFKYDLRRFMEYQIHMVDKLGIDVRLNTKATPEIVASLSPDAVIAAVGADPVIPPIPGVDLENVITAGQCYDKVKKGEALGETIAVLGGGLVGCETALYLSESLGKKVTLVEMLPSIAAEEAKMPRAALLEHMDKAVTYHVNARCTGITEKGLTFVDGEGAAHTIPADTVVLSAGMKPRMDEAETFRTVTYNFTPVGDCVTAKNIHTATRSGYDAAIQL